MTYRANTARDWPWPLAWTGNQCGPRHCSPGDRGRWRLAVHFYRRLYRAPAIAVSGVGRPSPARRWYACWAAWDWAWWCMRPRRGGASTDGFAKRRDTRKAVSAKAVRRSAAITRPGFGGQAPVVTESGTLLGRYGEAQSSGRTLKDVVLVLAPPQTGKTAYLGGRIIDAVGAGAGHQHQSRRIRATRADSGPEVGRVWVLNTEGLGGIASNFRWSPLEGCD